MSRRCLNAKGQHALDLPSFRPDGTTSDFNNPQHRKEARCMARELKRTRVIGSPPCTAFSIWNFGVNFKKMNHVDVAVMLQEGHDRRQFSATIYQGQVAQGRHFLNEHPAYALSWREPCIEALMNNKRVHTVTWDQCQFGLTKKVTPRVSQCQL